MKFGFVAKHRGIWPVAWLCGSARVCRAAGFMLAWPAAESRDSRSDERIGREVRASFVASAIGRMGPGGCGATCWQMGTVVRPASHRAADAAQALTRPPSAASAGLPDRVSGGAAVAGQNVLDRAVRGLPHPNQKWVADFTYLWTAEGWLYVAVVLDLFSRRVVGWSMSSTMTAQLVTDALMMAIWRSGKPEALMHHSDRGSQYTSESFQR